MKRSEFNRARTIEDICRTFMKLYDDNGIDKVSIQKLCEECGISRTIFYKYFDDKYDVLESIEHTLLQNLAELNQKLPQTQLETYTPGTPFPVFYETAKYILENQHYFKPLLGPHGDPQFIFRWKKQIRKDVYSKFEHDKIRTGDLNLVCELFAAAIIGLYTYCFFEDTSLTAQEISEIAGQHLCSAFYNFK